MVRKCLLVLLLIALLTPLAWSQASMGSVSGTVRDQSGAVVPAAAVVLVNTATNVTARMSTNEVGYYRFPGIIPGSYQLAVEQPGMQKFQGTLTVQVQQNAVVDPVLRPAGTTTTVLVADVTPLLTVDNPTLGHTLERQRIEQLPINGRSVTTLLSTVPGMETSGRAYGMRLNSQELVLDGAALTDKLWGGEPRRLPGLDSIQEFRVENNGSSAKFARPTSIILSTKSGTNSIHGSAFETNRNNGYGVARARQDGTAKPPYLNRNEFGISSGGPVYIPKIYNGKDRTFWFFSYEGSRLIAPRTMQFAVPTPEMRNGDFSGLVNEDGVLSKLYDPWTTDPTTWSRQQFNHGGKANVIDPAKMSPLAMNLFAITPLPTLPSVNPNIGNNWEGPVPANRRQWTTSSRIDHRFSDRDQVYGRYTRGVSTNLSQFYTQPMLNNVAGLQTTHAPNQSIAISHVHTFGPTLFNELLVSANRETAFSGTGIPGVKFADELGLPNPFNRDGWPGIYDTGLGNYAFETQNSKYSPFTYVILDDNATKIKGRHELQFGFHYRYDQLNYIPDQQHPQGNHDFAVLSTYLYDPNSPRSNPDVTAGSGHHMGNMFLGQAQYSNQFVHGYFYARAKEYALYFQDNFRVTSRLTLNLGLRWEYWPAYREKNNTLTSFDPSTKAIVLGRPMADYLALQATIPSIADKYSALGVKYEDAAAAGLPSTLMDDNKRNLGPRVGFAYRAGEGRSSFVIRGGFRSAFFPVPLSTWASRMRMNIPFTARFLMQPDSSATSPDGISNYSLRSVPTIIAGQNSRDILDLSNPTGSGFTRGQNMVSYFARNQADARTDDWNITFEKEFMGNTVARVGYVGNHGSNLDQYYRYNEAMPGYIWLATKHQYAPSGEYSGVATRPFDQTVYGTIEEYRKTGYSNNNGVQLELERRYSKGFGYQLTYNISNTYFAGGNGWNNVVPTVDQFMPGAVPADYDERNRFLNYQRDASIPSNRLRWNWIADLPFGKGKRFGGGAGPVLDRVIGGWQIAGMGTLWNTWVPMPTGIYPNGNKVEVYGEKYPIQDCRSGTCRSGYLWWNGYINPNLINQPNGIMGVPADYKPAGEPLNPWPLNPSKSDPMYAIYGSNTVWVPLNDGTSAKTTFNDNLHPWRQQYLPGARQWMLDASLYKNIPIKERLSARLNVDLFNVLNHPGNPFWSGSGGSPVGADGILSTLNSGQTPRQMQLSLRLLW